MTALQNSRERGDGLLIPCARRCASKSAPVTQESAPRLQSTLDYRNPYPHGPSPAAAFQVSVIFPFSIRKISMPESVESAPSDVKLNWYAAA